MRISRLAIMTLAVALLVAGFALGRVVTAMQGPPLDPRASTSAAPPEVPNTLPLVDVDGEDFAALPRYPDAVRTHYTVREAATCQEYLAVASIDDVSAFYRPVFVDRGWEVVDVQLAYGELRYLIANGDRDGVVDIESRGEGVVEIDLEVISSTAAPAGSPASPSPRPTPTPRPVTPPPDDDDGDDG